MGDSCISTFVCSQLTLYVTYSQEHVFETTKSLTWSGGVTMSILADATYKVTGSDCCFTYRGAWVRPERLRFVCFNAPMVVLMMQLRTRTNRELELAPHRAHTHTSFGERDKPVGCVPSVCSRAVSLRVIAFSAIRLSDTGIFELVFACHLLATQQFPLSPWHRLRWR